MTSKSKINSPLDWHNEDLIAYYEHVPVEEYQAHTVTGGLISCYDVDLIYPFIQSSSSLLELASGYGRVIEHLIKLGYHGDIYGIERSRNFFNYAQKQLGHQPKVHLLLGDIKHYSFNRQFDVLLWMWSGISDFSKAEQLPMLKKLKMLIAPQGLLILETFDSSLSPQNATTFDAQNCKIEKEYGNWYGYLPTSLEIQTYAQALGLAYFKEINYQTPTGRKRNLYILKNGSTS